MRSRNGGGKEIRGSRDNKGEKEMGRGRQKFEFKTVTGRETVTIQGHEDSKEGGCGEKRTHSHHHPCALLLFLLSHAVFLAVHLVHHQAGRTNQSFDDGATTKNLIHIYRYSFRFKRVEKMTRMRVFSFILFLLPAHFNSEFKRVGVRLELIQGEEVWFKCVTK